MGLKDRLRRLQREAWRFYETLHLPNGEEVKHTHNEMLEAFAASLSRRDHWLLRYVRRADTNEGMPGLINQLEASRERVRRDGA